MNREDILSLGQQAGWEMPQTWDESDGFLQRLERFVSVVIATEREVCAQIADEWATQEQKVFGKGGPGAAIRARGAK